MSSKNNYIKFRQSCIKEFFTRKKMINETPGLKFRQKIMSNDDKSSYERKNKKKMTILPIDPTSFQNAINVLNAVSTCTNKNNLNNFSKDFSINTPTTASDRNCKLVRPNNDDMKIIFELLYGNEFIFFNNNKHNLRNDKKKLCNYLIRLQKNFNAGGEVLISQKSSSYELIIDYYFAGKLEDLIARYSLIIFLFVRMKKYKEAKEIFFVLLKQNSKYMKYLEDKLLLHLKTDTNKNIANDFNGICRYLTRIYSFIIKYSQLFYTVNNRNKFISHYLRLQNLNYFFVSHKSNLSYKLQNKLKFTFAICLQNISYFCLNNYCPIKLSITFCNLIQKLYNDTEDYEMTSKEKSLIIKNLFNQGLFYYINNNKEKALSSLQEVINNVENFGDYNFDGINENAKNKIIKTKPKRIKTIDSIEITSSKQINRLRCSQKSSNKSISHESNEFLKSQKNIFDSGANIITKICEKYFKKKKNINDLTNLYDFALDKGIISEISKKHSMQFGKLTKKFKTYKKLSMRVSHGLSITQLKLNNYNIPKQLKNPIFRKAELLMAEIELERKNYKGSYNHVLNTIYLILLLKFSKPEESYDFELRLLAEYLKLIENVILSKKISDIYSIINENSSEKNKVFLSSNSNTFTELNLITSDESESNLNKIRKNTIKENIIKELQKFFLFMNSLSLYQLKVLNETQPINSNKRNSLPILFPSHFKDCLSFSQRIALDNLRTMAISRFLLLKNPNKSIIPTNLRTDILLNNKEEKKSENNNDITSKTLSIIDSIKNLVKIDAKISNELLIFKKMLNSKNTDKKMQIYLTKNYEFIKKIISKSNEEDIERMIKNPKILKEPIENYKALNNINLNEDFYYNYYNEMMNVDKKQQIGSSCPKLRLSNMNFYRSCHHFSPVKKKSGKKNKSVIERKLGIIDSHKEKNKFYNDSLCTKDYNDSYEEYNLIFNCSNYDS